MGFGLEVDMIRAAHEQDLLTAPYVFDPEQATDMARAGADVLVPHMGLTTGGAIGAETAKTLDDCVGLIQAMHDAAKRVNPEILVLCHGGPIAEPDDAAYVLERTEGVVGFFGASSMERLPTEVAMTENMRRFKALAVSGERPMSTFVMRDAVRQEEFDWGTIGWRLVPATGARQLVVMDVVAATRRRPRLPPPSRPGGDDHRPVRRDHPVHRAGLERCSGLGRLGVPGARRHPRVVQPGRRARRELQVVIGPSLGGETGYVLVDVSDEDPWRSMRPA